MTSLREFYNIWVDACEEVYGEYAMSGEYSEMYGEMVNALMQVKRHSSLLVDEMLESMNMPTHREINTLHQRLHEMRREYRALRDEIEQLRGETERPAASPAATKKAAPVKKRAPAKKRTTKKAAAQPASPKKRTTKKTTARKATTRK